MTVVGALLATPVALAAEPEAFAPRGVSVDRYEPVTAAVEVTIEAHDGVPLRARVFRPETSADPAWRTPVILVHSPYSSPAARAGVELFQGSLNGFRELDLERLLTPKGYTVVRTDVRGTGGSGGCFDMDGADQARDFGTLVEHFAAQPWSNGRVGSYGTSYDAEAQNAGAVYAPRGLATMVTVAGLSGLYDAYYYDGVPLAGAGASSAALYAGISALPGDDPASRPGDLLDRAGCQPEHVAYGADPSGDLTPYYREREFRLGAANVGATVLYVQGLSDTTVLPSNLRGWYDRLPAFKRAILGQWIHATPDNREGVANPDTWSRDDWADTVHAWFDRWLLGLDSGVAGWPPVQVQDEHNAWRRAESFDTLGAHRDLLLGDGTLGSGGGGTVTFHEAGQASWESPPLEASLHLSGEAVLDAEILLEGADDAHFALSLDEIRADGARQLTRGYLSARHRHLSEHPDRTGMPSPDGNSGPVVPGVATRYRIRTLPFDRWLEPGSRLRLTLAGADGSVLPAGSGFTAQVLVDGRSVLRVPLVESECNLVVAGQRHPPARPLTCE